MERIAITISVTRAEWLILEHAKGENRCLATRVRQMALDAAKRRMADDTLTRSLLADGAFLSCDPPAA